MSGMERSAAAPWFLAIVLAASSCGRAGGAASARVDAAEPAAAAAAPERAPSREPPPEPPSAPRCEDARDVHLFVSPRVPWAGAPLRIVAVTDRPMTAE